MKRSIARIAKTVMVGKGKMQRLESIRSLMCMRCLSQSSNLYTSNGWTNRLMIVTSFHGVSWTIMANLPCGTSIMPCFGYYIYQFDKSHNWGKISKERKWCLIAHFLSFFCSYFWLRLSDGRGIVIWRQGCSIRCVRIRQVHSASGLWFLHISRTQRPRDFWACRLLRDRDFLPVV